MTHSDRAVLAHICDVHLTRPTPFEIRNWGIKRGLGYLNWLLRRRHIHSRALVDKLVADLRPLAPDHIVVGGDVVNIGLPHEYQDALAWLTGLGGPQDVSVVPGNHDIYVPLPEGAGVGLWRNYMASGDWAKLDGVEGGWPFPFLRRVGPLVVIGVNSAVPTPPFVASGQIGSAQLKRFGAALEAVAAAGLGRVVVVHHPPLPGQTSARRGLKDADGFVRVIQRYGAELILHGHLHRDSLCWVEVGKKKIPVVGIGSGSAAIEHNGEPLARYNLVRIQSLTSHFAIEVETRGLQERGGDIGQILQQRIEVATA